MKLCMIDYFVPSVERRFMTSLLSDSPDFCPAEPSSEGYKKCVVCF